MVLKDTLAHSVLRLMRFRLVGIHRRMVLHLVYGAVIPWLFLAIIGRTTPTAQTLRLVIACSFISCCFMALRAPAIMSAGERMSGARALLLGPAGLDKYAYAATHILGSVLLAGIPFIILLAFAALKHVEAPQSMAWLVPMALLILALHGLGAWLVRSSMSIAVLMLEIDITVAAMVVFCPIFYVADAVPPILNPIVHYAPPTLAVDAVIEFWRGGNGWWPTSLLSTWAAGFLTLGYYRFRF